MAPEQTALVEEVIDAVFLVKTGRGLGRLGPQVCDHIVATEFERDKVIDLGGPARLGVRDAVRRKRLPIHLGGDSSTLVRRMLAHYGHVDRHHGPRSTCGIGKRPTDAAAALHRARRREEGLSGLSR
jgi:hypothetical protein